LRRTSYKRKLTSFKLISRITRPISKNRLKISTKDNACLPRKAKKEVHLDRALSARESTKTRPTPKMLDLIPSFQELMRLSTLV
jgi:hypothetical protein